jgi:hypothetical protein
MALKLKAVTSPVSLRALIARINRKLRHDGEILKTLRGERGRTDLGDYYIVDIQRNCIIQTDVDPEKLGRDLGVLAKWERVEEE